MATGVRSIQRVLDKRDTGTWVDTAGMVIRLLADDHDESRHQRFIIDTGAQQTLLIAHNLDLSERVPLGIGDRVRVRGVYECNDLGGLIHWTHCDPLGAEVGGYVRFRGRDYR